ncbi:alpha/beta hydrolase [Mycolicibacterium gadium]|uniref:Esterase n=1 Tax=Mycolicibacterium gadium TaxID=1794 RepID=A0A7I7WGK1_MYCGU|nr:alpha/beta hydrolase [Mycolicibacterium gadium]BBZ16769.1 esterase [Mycolicibacterium gadium]
MKRVAAVLGLAIVAAIVRSHLRIQDALVHVAPELRSPILPYVATPLTANKLGAFRLIFKFRTKPGSEVSVTQHCVGESSVRALLFTPFQRDTPSPAVLWIHGGGYVVGTPEFEAAGTGRLVSDLGVVAVSPDYRLAPEHPYPAGLDDCMTTLRWMLSHATDLGIDAGRVAVIGASAGGGLAAAVAQRCHDEGIALRAQVLVYPMLDDRCALRGDHGRQGRFAWTPESNTFGWTAYLGRAPRMSDAPEYAAPARRVDVSGLAPAWVGVGELDVFHDEDVDYAERLREAGVPCELVTVPGMYHGADGIKSKAPSMREFRASLLEHLRTHLLADG